MRVLLQCMRTSKFVNDREGWTEQSDEALEFQGSKEALIYCYQHHLSHMQILGRFNDPKKNFTIPLTRNSVE